MTDSFGKTDEQLLKEQLLIFKVFSEYTAHDARKAWLLLHLESEIEPFVPDQLITPPIEPVFLLNVQFEITPLLPIHVIGLSMWIDLVTEVVIGMPLNNFSVVEVSFTTRELISKPLTKFKFLIQTFLPLTMKNLALFFASIVKPLPLIVMLSVLTVMLVTLSLVLS